MKRFPIIYHFAWVLLFTLLSSCVPSQNLRYLQEKVDDEIVPSEVEHEYRLRPGDMLSIDVESGELQNEQPLLFQRERQSLTRSVGGNPIGSGVLYLDSYFINDSGYVQIPFLGSIELAGLTVQEANDVVQEEVGKYLKEGVAKVRLANFKVSIFGEINNPGTFQVYQSNINILDLISHAGEVTPYANRQNVMLIRNVDGEQKVEHIDLTDRRALNSPYFYLKPGDRVYVQPYMVAKVTGFATIPWSTIFSAVSTTLLLINFLSD